MNPKIFPEVDQNMTGEGCGDLPVVIIHTPQNILQIISCWEVTDEDLELITKTREVWLSCYGIQTPVALTAQKPFQPINATDEEFPDLIEIDESHFS